MQCLGLVKGAAREEKHFILAVSTRRQESLRGKHKGKTMQLRDVSERKKKQVEEKEIQGENGGENKMKN